MVEGSGVNPYFATEASTKVSEAEIFVTGKAKAMRGVKRRASPPKV